MEWPLAANPFRDRGSASAVFPEPVASLEDHRSILGKGDSQLCDAHVLVVTKLYHLLGIGIRSNSRSRRAHCTL